MNTWWPRSIKPWHMKIAVTFLLGLVSNVSLSAQSDSFVHTTDSSSIMGGTSEIGVTTSFAAPQIFLFQHRYNLPGSSGGTRYLKVIGQSVRRGDLFDFTNHYGVGNQDETTMPTGLHFNTLKTDTSDTVAFVHAVEGAPIVGTSERIDHPALNGNPTARVFINPQYRSGIPTNSSPVGLEWYARGEEWFIFTEDSSPMPADSTYVVVLPDPAK